MHPPIPPPVVKTISVLAESGLPRAGLMLAQALSIPFEPIQLAAAAALIKRGAVPLQLELFARFEDLPKSVQQLVIESSESLAQAFHQGLLHGSDTVRAQTLNVIRATDQFTQLGTLFELLTRTKLTDLSLILETTRHLVDRLVDLSVDRTGTERPRAAIEAARKQVLVQLETVLPRFDVSSAPEILMTAVLALAEPGHAVVKRSLWNGTPICREVAQRLLDESRHPGVLRFLAASLGQHYPHPHVFKVIQQRTDPEWIAILLKSMESRLSPTVAQNLKQVESIAWLEPPLDLLEAIPPALQGALVRFVAATRLPGDVKSALHEWLMQHGTALGRMAAEAGLPRIDEGIVQDAVRDGISSDDEEVQAWAVKQLRQHAIPEAFGLLVERLDSPIQAVQAAARQELASFNTERVLGLIPDLDPVEARHAGKLLWKIDLDAPVLLRRRLGHPARQKRIVTLQAILLLGLIEHFEDAVIALSDDADALVRRIAVEALGELSSPKSRAVLGRLLNDPHPRVRAAAEAVAGRHHGIESEPRQDSLQITGDESWM